MDTIVFKSVTKDYGNNRGIFNLSFEVHPGEIFGFLGPNGAGKTTTIRVMTDYIRPQKGQIKVLGSEYGKNAVEIKQNIGYLPGELSLYENMTGRQFLTFFGNLRGGIQEKYISDLIKRFECDLSPRIKTLSQGNKRKLGIIQAFMHKPSLVVLDEPTSGLDPLMQQEFYRLLKEQANEGKTIFISSHVLPEIEKVCDRVGIIRQGRLVSVERVRDLRGKTARKVEVVFEEKVTATDFRHIPFLQDVSVESNTLFCTVNGSFDPFVKKISAFKVKNIMTHEPSLEDVFMAYYKKGEDSV